MEGDTAREAVGDYRYGFHDPESATIRFDKGLSESVVRDISELKNEPEWMTEMRVKARESGVYLRVVRNTLAKRAVEGTEYECLSESFVGPTLVAFSHDDPGSAARLLKDYAKEHEDLEVKAVAIGGQAFGADQIDRVATLPTLDEARAMLMSVMQAPIVKLARTLNEVPGKLVRVVAAVKDQKEAQGD